MFLKSDWKIYVHGIRKEEIKRAFSLISAKTFNKGIEFGAGDGYQTTLIGPKCSSFISSDLNFKRLKDEYKIAGVDYRACDADALAGQFDPNYFDLIFSSNLIEHLSDRNNFLQEARRMLFLGGQAIHIAPSRMFKVSYLLLFYPNLFLLIIDRIVGIFLRKPIFRGAANNFENNLNSVRTNKINKWKRILWPQIYGNYQAHLEEWRSWSRNNWQKLFEDNGYLVTNYIKGPVFSGYGFGCDRFRGLLENLGWSSEHIFILKKIK